MLNQWFKGIIIWLGLTIAGVLPAQIQAFPSLQQISDQIRARLAAVESPAPLLIQKQRLQSGELLYRFYQEHDFRPTWLDDWGVIPLARDMVTAIQQSRFEGLDPARYHIDAIRNRISMLDETNQTQDRVDTPADLDLLLTDAFLQISLHLYQGQQPGQESLPAAVASHLLAGLEKALWTERISDVLEGFKTARQDEEVLRQALGRYLSIEAEGGWPVIPPGNEMAKGDRDPKIPILRKRLQLTGDLVSESNPDAPDERLSPVFDTVLESAVQRFQGRHGLRKSGILDHRTRFVLNEPVEKRLLQIRININQRRRLPRDLGERYLIVNIPEMALRAVEDEKTALKMRVVVGKPEQQTPVFNAEVPYLVINPYWYIPPDIAEREILPAVKKNPDYLASKGIRLFRKMSADEEEIASDSVDWLSLDPDEIDFYFRQEPGWDNSLGAVKFVIPNQQHIYLHDTPSKGLFQHSLRALSSGCVRVEHPLELAAFLLQGDQKWSRSEIWSLMKSGDQRKLVFKEPVPIYVVYWTVDVDRKGQLRFLPDIYNLEPELAAELAAPKQ
ncbi:L,D-transpeptidase family protein [bacterium]|nr:L,D-transpeptidase family protein [bacterium]